MSSNNPFRTPGVTPTPTGASATTISTIPSNDAGRPQAQSNGRNPGSIDITVRDILSEELPPAYTPSPNVYEGEATLEVGPRRPFQQPAPVPPQHTSHFPPPSWGVSPHSTAGSWSSFPGQQPQPVVSQYTAAYAPPARPSSTPPAHASDFARDFYAAGAGDSGLYGGESSQYQHENSGASSSSSGRYAPPPGEPPSRSGKSSASPASNGVPNDGRPTERPVPGHPLLRHGKTLVYPQGFECQKCRNTGYKNFDPSHPCPRCWEKYAKPFSGAITYTSWTSDGPSAGTTTFQRPLPTFTAPQAALHQQSVSWSGPVSNLSRAATTSRASQPYGSGYPGASARVVPIAGGALPMGPYLDRLVTGSGRSGFPPPSWQHGGGHMPSSPGNGGVFSPGDPRIGGRLCWRCGGRGKTSFLIFDETTCSICNGIGRTFA